MPKLIIGDYYWIKEIKNGEVRVGQYGETSYVGMGLLIKYFWICGNEVEEQASLYEAISKISKPRIKKG